MIRKKSDVGPPEGPYGLLDIPAASVQEPAFRPTSHRSSIRKRRPREDARFPRPEITYDRLHLPSGVDPRVLENVIPVPESVLKSIQTKSEKRSKNLAKLLLSGNVPSMLSVDYAFDYARAALSDGFDLNVDVDSTISDALVVLGRLDVLVFFIQRMRMPRPYKKLLLETLIDRYSTHIITELEKSIKSSGGIGAAVRKLEAYIQKASDKQSASSEDVPQGRKVSATRARRS